MRLTTRLWKWLWVVSCLWRGPGGPPRPPRASPRPWRGTRWPSRAWNSLGQGQEAQSFKILDTLKVGWSQNAFKAIYFDSTPFKSIFASHPRGKGKVVLAASMVTARNLLTKLFKGRPWANHQKTMWSLSYGCLLLLLIYLVIFSEYSEKDATLLLLQNLAATPSQWPWCVSSLWGQPGGPPRPPRASPRPWRRTRWQSRAWRSLGQGQEAQSFKILDTWKVGWSQTAFKAIYFDFTPLKAFLQAIQWFKTKSLWLRLSSPPVTC